MSSDSNIKAIRDAIAGLGLTPRPDLFERLNEDEVIIIWNLQGKQVFRSPNGFKLWSYTLDQLQGIPFYELFERDPAIGEKYIEYFTKLVKGEIRETTLTDDIPTHIVTEKRSKKKWRTLITPLLISPLMDEQDRVVAFVHSCRAQHLPD
jgi:PAS domain-containing protein